MAPRFVYVSNAGLFPKFIAAIEDPLKKAAAFAMAEVGKEVVARGTAQVAASGLSSRWQRGLQFRVYTDAKKHPSEIAATSFFHRIGLFNVFERGIRIAPGKLMWLPITGLRSFSLLGSRRLTPKKYAETIGPLVSVNVPGKPPMLFAKADRGRRGRNKVTLASLKRGGRGVGNVESVPVFIGVPAVTIRKRFDISGIVQRATARLPQLFEKFLKVR